jgi:hypothetical protein
MDSKRGATSINVDGHVYKITDLDKTYFRKELKSPHKFILDTQLWKIGTDGTTLQNKRCPDRSEWKLITDNSGSKLRKIARVSSIFALGIQISCPSYGPNIFMRRYFSITGELTDFKF